MTWFKALWLRQASAAIPSECYDECNNAALAAETIGKTPALCEPGSEFQQTLGFCQSCIKENSAGNAYNSTVQPQFQGFLNYCNNLSPSDLSAYQSQSQRQSSAAAAQSSLSAQLASANATTGTDAPSVKTLLAEQTSASAALDSLNSQLFSVTRTQPHVTGNILSSQLVTTTEVITTTPIPTASSKSTPPVAVIVPAVIVPVVSVAAIGTIVLYLLRRRKRRKDLLVANAQATDRASENGDYCKPELHADDVRPELDSCTVAEPQEVTKSVSTLRHPGIVELPAIEPIGSELDAQALILKDPSILPEGSSELSQGQRR